MRTRSIERRDCRRPLRLHHCHRSLDARDGSVVVAVVDSELTIKRLRIGDEGIRLVPENPAYPDIVLGEMSELTIWGVVTRCLHRV